MTSKIFFKYLSSALGSKYNGTKTLVISAYDLDKALVKELKENKYIIKFKWQKHHDEILDDLYIPVCIVEIKTRDGKWRSEVLRVDSSADTILMDKNDCGLLGYTFNECITTTAVVVLKVVVLKSHLMLEWRSVESPSYQDLL